jgi:hypothetical protein
MQSYSAKYYLYFVSWQSASNEFPFSLTAVVAVRLVSWERSYPIYVIVNQNSLEGIVFVFRRAWLLTGKTS